MVRLPAVLRDWRWVGCWEIWAPILGSLVLWGAFWAPLFGWIALAPFALLAQSRRSTMVVYLGAQLGGLTYFLLGVHWIRYCDPSAWLAWLLLALYLSIYFPAAVLVTRLGLRRWGLPVVLGFPIAWTAGEFIRMHLMTGFGWLLLAHTQHSWLVVIQSADLGGVYLVSFVVALCNGFLADAVSLWCHQRTADGRSLGRSVGWRAALCALMIGGNAAYGIARLRSADFRVGPRVAGVQTNVPQSLKDGDPEQSFQHLIRITAQARRLKANLVVWPETSYPFPVEDVPSSLSELRLDELRIARRGPKAVAAEKASEETGKWIRERAGTVLRELRAITDGLGAPLLVGGLHYPYREAGLRQYNAAMLFLPEKGLVAVYNKQHLVPFGEFLPLESTLPFLRRLMPYADDVEYGLDASSEPLAFHVGDWNFVSMICFEDTLPHLGRDFIQRLSDQRIDFLVNQSNDGWFQGSEEADYHLVAGLFRCVELRRPMVRVSNTGISALIDGNGQVVEVLTDKQGRSKWIAGVLNVVVPLDDRASVYLRVGDWFAWSCLGVSLVLLVFARLRPLANSGIS